MDGAQSCTRCVMDTSAPDIRFDADGVCNYCTEYLVTRAKYLDANPVTRQQRLDALLRDVRNAGRGKPYDCIIGVSGGVDSSWALALAVGLMACGRSPCTWTTAGTPSSPRTISRTSCVGLGVDLHTHVIDWPEYRGLMEAFFAADVVDVELLYDNAMLAVNFEAAARHGVKHILGGTNVATEGMRMPPFVELAQVRQAQHQEHCEALRRTQAQYFPVDGHGGLSSPHTCGAHVGSRSWTISTTERAMHYSRCRGGSITSRTPSSITSPSSPASTRATSFPISSGSTKGACTCPYSF